MPEEEIILKGVPICRGIAIGKPYFFHWKETSYVEQIISENRVEKEIASYRDALAKTKEDLLYLQKQLQLENIYEGANILEAELHMMEDPLLVAQVENEIRSRRKSAQTAFQSVIAQYQQRFSSLRDPFFRERFKEIQDISRRVMAHLHSMVRVSLANAPANAIVFSKELAAADTAEAKLSRAGAFITESGGVTSHAAILAKARGTPYVSSISFDSIDTTRHQIAIVDGRTGEVILSPSHEKLAYYYQLRKQLETHLNKLDQVGTLRAETLDGFLVHLSANIEMASELEILHQHGAYGVGLFRSEYLCLSKGSFPSEDEQYKIYEELVSKMQGLPIVIRTFDVGGDKGIPHQRLVHEINPFLGCRAIRFLLKEKEIFKEQLRAILRASLHGNVSILFPMISTLSELKEAKAFLAEAHQELQNSGYTIPKVRIGCMIEVPSAALIADLLAKECDFLSIGTNDLVQYALAVDRSNHALNSLYTPTHPSVIRMIKLIVHEANHHGIPVSICGEVAADPRFTPLLLGLGVHELSVAARYLPIVKNAIRYTSIVAASQLAEKVLSLATASEIQELISKEYKKNVPEDCFFNY